VNKSPIVPYDRLEVDEGVFEVPEAVRAAGEAFNQAMAEAYTGRYFLPDTFAVEWPPEEPPE